MQMIQCPNCGKLTGFKRALGFGTFFMVLITLGLWLLVIPFYPARCINCGLTRHSAIVRHFLVWYRSLNRVSKTYLIIAPFLLLFGIGIFNALKNTTWHTPAPIVDNNRPALNEENNAFPQTVIPPDSQTEPSFQKAQVYASAERLMIDRQTGGAAVAERYLGKVIQVQGVVDTASSTDNSPSISFKVTGICPLPGGNRINCDWMAERERGGVTKIHPGDSVTVLGRFGTSGKYWMPKEYDIPGCAVYITLDNCTVKSDVQSGTTDNAPITSPNSGVTPNDIHAPVQGTYADPNEIGREVVEQIKRLSDRSAQRNTERSSSHDEATTGQASASGLGSIPHVRPLTMGMTSAVHKGQTSTVVLAILGPPVSVTLGAKHVYSYPNLKVVFVDGKVSEIIRSDLPHHERPNSGTTTAQGAFTEQ
jgi:hypothetical protein